MADQPEDVLNAIDRVIKDVDRKYDECLVEHFIESFDINCPDIDCRGPEILQRLQFYFEHKSFLMLNQTRAFKILKSILPKQSTLYYAQELENIIPLLNSFWKTLDTIVLNNNSSAMAIMFDILNQVTSLNETGVTWLLEREVTPPIRLSIPIEDISSLIKYYITKCNNYHTKNKAEKLLQTIIIRNSCHPGMGKFIQLVQELILECSSVSVLIQALETHPQNCIETLYKISETLENSFMINIDKTNVDINKLCKHLALTNLSRKVIIEKLRSKKKLDGIIYYISNSAHKDNQFDQLLLSYVLYPLLAKFNDEETQSLVNRLMATRDEKDFVEWNMNTKTQTLCLVQLNHILLETMESKLSWPFTMRTLNMIIATLTNHIRCNYSLKCTGAQVKNMSECCHILNLILTISKEERIIYKIYKITHNILVDIESNDLTKPVALQLLKVMLLANNTYARILYVSRMDKVDDIWLKTIELAYKFKDPDLLNEFTEFFRNTSFFLTENHNQDDYAKLVFDHIYQHVKDTEHRELLGNLAEMLISIDLLAKDTTLKKVNIRRYHDVPIIVSDIIDQKIAVPTTIEKVISIFENDSKCDYLDRFSCSEVREKFAKALTLVLKSDSSEYVRVRSIELISRIFHLWIQEHDEAEKVLEKLISSDILRTLYEVSSGSLYCPLLYRIARLEIYSIKEEVISKVKNLDEIVLSEDLVNFYTSQAYCEADQTNILFWAKEMKSSYVKDILNENSEKGISECY